MSVQKLIPYCRSAIWGGSTFKKAFESPLANVAEAWVWSGIKGAESHLANGEPLKDERMLVKLLDAAGYLSVQVHPSESANKAKTEMWYILSADEGAFVYLGVADFCAFLAALTKGEDPTPYLNKIFVKAGDVLYIPAGTVHALGKGIRLLEMQQASDVTYRLYDFGRTDANGAKRELHIEKGLAAAKDLSPAACEKLRFEKGKSPLFCRSLENAQADLLAHSRFFACERVRLFGGRANLFAKTPTCAVVTEGSLVVNGILYPTYTPLFLQGQATVSGDGEIVLCASDEGAKE